MTDKKEPEITIMKKQGFSSPIFSAAAVALVLFLNVALAVAKDSTIVRFNGKDGLQPRNGLVADGQGNFYGVTPTGGNNTCAPRGCGVVFELSPASGGGWTETIIYAFKGGTSDTSVPVTDLVFDTKGNLFGATGVNDNNGAIFELSPGAGGTWTEKILFSFSSAYFDPGTHLAFDSKGNLYGSVLYSANFSQPGGVFELSPQSNGTWLANLIHVFTGTNGDGKSPYGGVVVDGQGNVYGTTYQGGASNYGTVFELSPNGTVFTETILYNFTNQTDGSDPMTPLTFDTQGNLYGTTSGGGPVDNAFGVVFELSQSAGKWNETVLYSFGNAPDGYRASGVVFDAKGNLYGTTESGGAECNSPGCGIVFELTPQSSGPWKETRLHNFESAGDGSISAAGVVVDNSTGKVYGTTEYGGGRNGYGTVFEIQP
jgi:uncharacterized repeat protein (TIGR03803 family)